MSAFLILKVMGEPVSNVVKASVIIAFSLPDVKAVTNPTSCSFVMISLNESGYVCENVALNSVVFLSVRTSDGINNHPIAPKRKAPANKNKMVEVPLSFSRLRLGFLSVPVFTQNYTIAEQFVVR